MTTVISGSSPSITFSDATTQTTAFTSTPSVTSITTSADSTIHGLTIGQGAGSVATNTVLGNLAQVATNTGGLTVAIGYSAGNAITSGDSNNFIGAYAGRVTTTGAGNVGVGTSVLYDNVSGNYNIAVGQQALRYNTASNNTAVGYQAGYTNTTGVQSNYVGRQAGYTSNASYCTMMGDQAGYASTGAKNTFIGYYAGGVMTTGANNTILGGYNGNQGSLDIRTASNYIVLSDGDGNPRLVITTGGDLRVPQVYNTTSGSGANVYIDSGGNFYRSTSSLKYKKNIEEATHGLAEVLQLRPVTYKGKSENDGETIFGGLIAEEVHAVGLTEFVQYAEDGLPDALAYGNMVSLCIKAIQELSAKVTALENK